MQDLVRDWRRWSPLERVIAVVLLALLTLGVPTLVLSTASGMPTAHEQTPSRQDR